MRERLHYYVLNKDRTTRPVEMMEWATGKSSARGANPDADPYRVAFDYWIDLDVKVSTVFLGIDHEWGDGPPLLFETMVFAYGYPFDEDIDRYTTWGEAAAGHAAMVEAVKAQLENGAVRMLADES